MGIDLELKDQAIRADLVEYLKKKDEVHYEQIAYLMNRIRQLSEGMPKTKQS